MMTRLCVLAPYSKLYNQLLGFERQIVLCMVAADILPSIPLLLRWNNLLYTDPCSHMNAESII